MRTRSLLALALLATFIVQAATPREAPLAASPVETLRGVPLPALTYERSVRVASAQAGGTPSMPAAALPSTGAPVSVPARFDGWISWAELDYGDEYVATRYPRGTLVRICAVECIVRITTDFGPSAAIKPARIADVAVLDWEAICHLPRTRGVCRGSVERVEIGLPATDTR